jgi:membrane associated rhomboid family serine protease
MLIPIGQESNTVRRVPWVTIAIIALCVIIHIFNAGAISEFEDKLFDIYNEIYEYYTSHPYLELDQELKQTFFINEELDEVLKSMTADKYSAGPDEEQLEEEQTYLDNLVEELDFTKKSLPFYKFGLVPKKKTFVGLIGHMFLHAGWLHLLGNLLYLYLLGPFIEDAWGKPAYAVFYLGTGILAALAFATHYPNSGVPMVGASGAISGVMGGFLIRYWHARIRYFYMFSLLIRGTFTAPAWVMLPVGFIMELINASIMDSIVPGGGGGVAHWAHVWGFIFGVAGAFLIKFLKIEEKFVAPEVEAETTYVNKSFVAYEEAMQALADGDKEKAYAILIDAAKEDPTNQDVIETLWNIAPEIGKTSEVAPLLTRLIEKEVQQARLEAALFHYKHLRSKVPDTRFSTHTKIMIFEQSVNVKDLEEAKILYRELLNEVNLASPPGLVLELCSAALKFDLNFDKSLANKVIELARQHPEVPEDRKESLKQQLYAIPKQKKDAPIKVDSHYDHDFSELDSKGDMGGVKGASSVSGASSLIVPLVPTAPTTPSASQEPAIPVTPSQSQPPPIPQETAIPIKPREPAMPITPPQSQPPPIFEEPTIPKNPREPEIPLITREPIIPMEYTSSQPPPIPIEPVIPIDPQEPGIPLITQEPTIPITPSQSQPPPPGPRKSFRVTKAVPLGVKGGKIALNIENMGQRIFALEKIKAIAVVKISPPGERPFLLIDLFVDDPGAPTAPTAQEAVIRTLRLLSTNFNPQKFVAHTPGQGPLEAFKIFSSSLLKLSNAKPFPDIDSVQLKKVAGYRSINEYEDSLLSAEGT